MNEPQAKATERAPVLIEQQQSVRVLTLNQPDKRNALTITLRTALRDALHDAIDEPSCRVIVLAGAGPAFCAGGDLSGMPPGDTPQTRAWLGILANIVSAIHQGPKPVIAAVHGATYGAGLSLAAACDYVIADRTARFCSSFGKVGLAADTGLLWTLPKRIGLGRTKAMTMFSTVIDAPTAHTYGLVEEIVPDGTAATHATERATELATGAPLAITATKVLTAGPHHCLDDLLAAEGNLQPALLASKDFSEGRRAFFEGRKPQFRGE